MQSSDQVRESFGSKTMKTQCRRTSILNRSYLDEIHLFMHIKSQKLFAVHDKYDEVSSGDRTVSGSRSWCPSRRPSASSGLARQRVRAAAAHSVVITILTFVCLIEVYVALLLR